MSMIVSNNVPLIKTQGEPTNILIQSQSSQKSAEEHNSSNFIITALMNQVINLPTDQREATINPAQLRLLLRHRNDNQFIFDNYSHERNRSYNNVQFLPPRPEFIEQVLRIRNDSQFFIGNQ